MRLVLLPFLVLPASAVDFSKEVYPVLQRACFECHGAEVQKGDLRLDTASPKHAEIGQELLRRVQLPREDKEAMPKRGERLKPEQIAAVRDLLLGQASAWTAKQVAKQFKGTKLKELELVLESLTALGLLVAFQPNGEMQWKPATAAA